MGNLVLVASKVSLVVMAPEALLALKEIVGTWVCRENAVQKEREVKMVLA
jgi:hypothetical protein